MPRTRTQFELAAGKLISALGKEWHKYLGEDVLSEQSDTILNKAHDFLQARNAANAIHLLDGKSISEYLGEEWLTRHTQIMPYIQELEKAIRVEQEELPEKPSHVDINENN